jgi:PhoH-like ATPase
MGCQSIDLFPAGPLVRTLYLDKGVFMCDEPEQRKSMTKYFVLDTNVLLHNPASIFSFTDNTVVIPINVIEELDHFKSSSDKNGMHARQVLREIDALIKKGALDRGAKLDNGGRLRIGFVPRDTKLPTDMDRSIADNKILSVALEFQEHGKDAVFFVSKDVNARIKAHALGIKSRDYEKQQVEYLSLYAGWREVSVSDELMSKLYEEGKIAIPGVTFHPNEFAALRLPEANARDVLCRWNNEDEGLRILKDGQSCFGIKPLNREQRFAFELLLDDRVQLVSLVGQAGTGKTLIALACALEKTLQLKPTYERVLVARPVIPMGRDIGYLPGTKDQKLSYWMRPIFDNLDFLLARAKPSAELGLPVHRDKKLSVEDLQQANILEIEALTYIRGRSIPNQFIVVDEAQNLTPHEIKTIISRAGRGTKIVLTGDPEQIDNPYLDANSNGLTYLAERLKNEKLFGHVLLSKSERSPLAAMAVQKL